MLLSALFFSKLIAVSNVTEYWLFSWYPPRCVYIHIVCIRRYRDLLFAKPPPPSSHYYCPLISSWLAKIYRYTFLLGGRALRGACHKLFAFIACMKRVCTRGASTWISIPRARCLKMIGSERRASGKLFGASRRISPLELVGAESDGSSYSPV